MTKRARFTDDQIVRILQEADRAPVAKSHGISQSSINENLNQQPEPEFLDETSSSKQDRPLFIE